jgi:hypothetical protein
MGEGGIVVNRAQLVSHFEIDIAFWIGRTRYTSGFFGHGTDPCWLEALLLVVSKDSW